MEPVCGIMDTFFRLELSICLRIDTYLFLLFVEVINDDTNEQVEREEGAKYDEKDKV